MKSLTSYAIARKLYASLTERAFEHLNRSIVVDSGLRQRWQAAHDRNEPACEALGGVHLLSHGIWAFKAKGPKAETDLVYQEPPTDIGRIKRSSDGLVLTEWKRFRTGDDPARLFETARKAGETIRGWRAWRNGIEEIPIRGSRIASARRNSY